MQTFFPDDEAPATPFNTRSQTEQKQSNSKKNGYAAETVAMAGTINATSQKNARMWQIIALVALSSFFFSLLICLYAVKLPKTVPIIVTVDSQGQATYVGTVDKNYWGKERIPENAKTYQIKRLFANMYTWVTDSSAQKSYINECGTICQGQAITLLDQFFATDNPFDFIGIRTKTIDMEEPLRQTERTYVIYYNVNTLYKGSLEKTERFSALVTLDFYQGVPESNPLGIYITHFDIKPVTN